MAQKSSGTRRLKRRAEFLRVAAKGSKAPMPGLVLQALSRHDEEPARLGFTVTKKVGNAVVRNRTKRRLREAARLLLAERPLRGVDLVLIGRDGTRSRPFPALIDDIARALRKTGAMPGRPAATAPAVVVPGAASGAGPDGA
ncbi:ribonuclease P protein component [Rhizosaccharibacter radicis]|uniref:Ribonuclease P protein component n=1 Tax=Rhizosaccharibacter radicis TaxID=2782605 RepID=A0ABT1VX84_9PROT|nr:ribonuclease P protein component [Acetobacteraceae bacterium KSS12]